MTIKALILRANNALFPFQPLIAFQGERDSAFRMYLYEQILDAIATHEVADRPDRYFKQEPTLSN